MRITVSAFTILIAIFGVNSEPLPVVLWHGMGDSCCFPFSLGNFKKSLEAELPGVYVLSLKFGADLVDDVKNGYFLHPNKQIQQACDTIQNDPRLQGGFNAIGFSQGSQFLRALKQRCATPRMVNLVSFGGQHQGVFGLPNCPSLSSWTCEKVRQMLSIGSYWPWVQRSLVQATYWHDPTREDEYRKFSTFLADINNENTVNETYRTNLKDLKRFVMVKFENDTIVQPRETQWFGYYKPGQDKELLPLEQMTLYTEDRLGLQEMNTAGKLFFLQTEGNHLKFSKQWFIVYILPFLQEGLN